jgi:hypothetical protein
MTGKTDKKIRDANPNFATSIQTSLNRLISEEWFAAATYELFINSVELGYRHTIDELFSYIAADEKNDHLRKLINCAIQYGYQYPSTYAEFKKYANEEDVKLFETFKSNRDPEYYLNEAIKAETRAIESYELALSDYNLDKCIDMHNVFLSNQYDEVEHLNDINYALTVTLTVVKDDIY